MRYSATENPYIWVRFNTGDTPIISIYDASDNSVIINDASMSELLVTGYFKYYFNPSVTILTNYFYIVKTTNEEFAGAFTLGGYPDNILEDTNELQTNQDDWLTATGFSVPNEYDNELTNIQSDLDNPDQYKATGFSVPNEYDTELTNILALLDRVLLATEIKQAEINDTSTSSTKFITTLTETTNNFWVRAALLFTSGNNKGQIRAIKNYNGSTKEITIQTPLSFSPVNTDTFIICVGRKYLTPDITELVEAIEDSVIEGTLTNIEMKRIIFSALAGLCSGGGTTNIKFRDVENTKDRIDATVIPLTGDRTNITVDGS